MGHSNNRLMKKRNIMVHGQQERNVKLILYVLVRLYGKLRHEVMRTDSVKHLKRNYGEEKNKK